MNSLPFKPPALRVLRWLIDPGAHAPGAVRAPLLTKLFWSPSVVAVGVVNSVIVSVLALFMHCGLIFGAFIACDLALGTTRVLSMRAVSRGIARGELPRIEAFLLASLGWFTVEGAIAFVALQTGRTALELLVTISVFGIIGPTCARSYPAPRFAFTLVALIDLPFVAGCVFTGDHWLLATLPETPPFLFAIWRVVELFQRLAVDSLRREVESHDHATHDPLTGLFNRRGLREVIAAAGPGHERAALLALDLDGFKAVNDRHGHHVGDALLSLVASRLLACTRPGDSVVRLGGDEFVVLAPALPAREADGLCRRILEAIGQSPYQVEGVPLLQVGVSIGFACAPEDGGGIEELHRHADLALYAAKAMGKGVHLRADPAAREAAAPPGGAPDAGPSHQSTLARDLAAT